MLNDIFSKKKEKQNKPQKVIVDHREKNSLVPILLEKENLKIEYKQMKIGDYFVNGVLVERKTLQDFASSMINKRLYTQLKNMEKAKNKLLIIEGNELSTNVNRKALKGFEISIMINSKTPILKTNSAEETAKIIGMIANQKKRKTSLVENKKDLTKEERQRFILESFEGIGPTKSQELLEEFGSIKKIINSSEEELEKILGKKARTFRETIN